MGPTEETDAHCSGGRYSRKISEFFNTSDKVAVYRG